MLRHDAEFRVKSVDERYLPWGSYEETFEVMVPPAFKLGKIPNTAAIPGHFVEIKGTALHREKDAARKKKLFNSTTNGSILILLKSSFQLGFLYRTYFYKSSDWLLPLPVQGTWEKITYL